MDELIHGISRHHFRLKSERRRKRWHRRSLEKELIKLHFEEWALINEIRSLGYEELNPPVQRGWERSFVVREDVARSKDGRFFQGILDKINTVQYSWKRDFKVRRRQRGKKVYVVREQHVQDFWEYAFRKANFTTHEATYFDCCMTNEKIGSTFRWIYRFREPWRFKLKVEPNIIRRKAIRDFNLESRLHEIRHKVDRDFLRPKMHRIIYGRYKWWLRHDYDGDLSRYAYHPLKNTSFASILDEYLPDTNQVRLTNKPSNTEGFIFYAVVKHTFDFPKLTELVTLLFQCFGK